MGNEKMKYLGMDKKEFLIYVKQQLKKYTKSIEAQKKRLKELGLGDMYDQ